MDIVRSVCTALMLLLSSASSFAQDFMSLGDAVFSAASTMQMNSAIHCQTNDCPEIDISGDFIAQLPRPSVEQVRALVIAKRKPEITAGVEQELYKRIKANDPAAARAFLDVVKRYDIISMFNDLVEPYTLRANRLNDALTAYWVMAWTVIHQAEIPPPPPVRAANGQLYKLLAHNPVVQKATLDQRQQAADGLIYQFMFLHGSYTRAQRTGDKAMLKRLAAETQRSLVASGIDLSKFELTAETGFKPRD